MHWPLTAPGASARRPRPALRAAVRTAAAAGMAAAVVAPLVRRRARLPATATVAATAAGPLGLAILRPRTKARDAVLYALQMWGFTIAHELPYDDPEALRRRLKVRYPMRIDRVLGGGELPGIRLQHTLGRRGEVSGLDRVLSAVHWAWFFEPHLALATILVRHNESFARAARQMSATYDLGCAVYFAVPTAPPWWAADEGHLHGPVSRVAAEVARQDAPELRRLMVDVGEDVFGRAWPRLYDALGGNPWAAMPSLHFGSSLMAALLLSEAGSRAAAVGWAYAAALGFALVYLGEHYVTDLLAGATMVAVVRLGEPRVEPLALRLSSAVQRLERIAAS